jgi:hypothetical protein
MWLKTVDSAEAQRDLQHGQIVIVTARWILIAAGLFLAVFYPGPIEELRLEIAVIFGLSAVNFALHTSLLRGRRVSPGAVYAASAADLSVISLLLLQQGGFDSQLYVLYFPALVFSVAFTPLVTLAYTATAIGVYGLIALSTASDSADDAPVILTRLLMLGAVAFCGFVYWQIEHARRRRDNETRRALEQQLRPVGTSPNEHQVNELAS